jgi:PAS domain S-box-containing protein
LLAHLQTGDGLFCVDSSSQQIIHWNEAAERMLGFSANEVLGRPCYEVVGGRESQNYLFCRPNCPTMANARRGRATSDYDVMVQNKGGDDLWLNVSTLVLKSDRGESPAVIHLIRNVTERRRVEGLARRAMESLRQLDEESNSESANRVRTDPRPTPLPALSKREMQVLQLLASGMGTREIADNLGISPITARNHITHVVSKLGANSRLQAVLYASRRHLI